MRSIGVGPRVLAALGLLAVAGVTGCAANSTPKPVASVLNQPISLGSTASASPGARSTATATSSAAASASPAASGTVRNLTVSTALLNQVTAAFASLNHIPVSDIAGSAPTAGSVYYAYEPATNTYWAMARFEPASGDSGTVQAKFQDGGNVGEFWQAGTGPWHAGVAGEPVLCGMLTFFPPVVLKVWDQPTTRPAYC